jgi:hypothetical protein
MNINELAKEVSIMRALQRQYFKTRDPETLAQSKAQEKKVDVMVSQIMSESEQTSLF